MKPMTCTPPIPKLISHITSLLCCAEVMLREYFLPNVTGSSWPLVPHFTYCTQPHTKTCRFRSENATFTQKVHSTQQDGTNSRHLRPTQGSPLKQHFFIGTYLSRSITTDVIIGCHKSVVGNTCAANSTSTEAIKS